MFHTLVTRARDRVLCRDRYGRRCRINLIPRPEGHGVLLRTSVGDLYLSPLEVGRMRQLLAETVVRSASTPIPAGKAA